MVCIANLKENERSVVYCLLVSKRQVVGTAFTIPLSLSSSSLFACWHPFEAVLLGNLTCTWQGKLFKDYNVVWPEETSVLTFF